MSLESGRSYSRRIFWDYPGVRSTGGRLPEQAHWPRIVVHFRLWYNSVSGFGDLEATHTENLGAGFSHTLGLCYPARDFGDSRRALSAIGQNSLIARGACSLLLPFSLTRSPSPPLLSPPFCSAQSLWTRVVTSCFLTRISRYWACHDDDNDFWDRLEAFVLSKPITAPPTFGQRSTFSFQWAHLPLGSFNRRRRWSGSTVRALFSEAVFPDFYASE